MSRKPSVLCLGSHILDIINAPLRQYLKAGEGVITSIGIHPGGNAFNVAADLAQLCGASVTIGCVGAVGDDHPASLFINEFSRHGITPYLQTIPRKRTGANIILQVKNEERRFHLDPGANPFLGVDHVLSTIDRIRPDFLYIGELSILGSCRQALPDISSRVHRYGGTVILDLMISESDEPDYLFEAAPSIDMLHCNEYEASSITGHANPTDAVNVFYQKGFHFPIVSNGKNGFVCIFKDTLYTVPAFSVDEIDATGAGDAFVAGFLSRILKLTGSTLHDKISDNDILIDTLLYSSASGGCAVTMPGCTDAVTRENVDRLFSLYVTKTKDRITSTPLH